MTDHFSFVMAEQHHLQVGGWTTLLAGLVKENPGVAGLEWLYRLVCISEEAGGAVGRREPTRHPSRSKSVRPEPSVRVRPSPRDERRRMVQPDTPTTVAQSWKQLRTRSKAAILALIAVLGGWSTVKQQAVDPLVGLYEGRQPHQDEERLRDLRAGFTFGRFQAVLGVSSSAVIAQGIPVDALDPDQTLRDELFILPTVYVEAFVDNSQTVLAFTVTLRSVDEQPEFDLPLGTSIRLGETTIADVNVGPASVAGVCGVHMVSYHEASAGAGFENFQVLAVGQTLAGALPDGVQPVCPPDLAGLSIDPVMSLDPDPERFVTDVHVPTRAFLASISDFRESAVVNTVTVVAPFVPLLPVMISLHADTVQSVATED